MQKLTNGAYFGSHYQKTVLHDCIITDTEYTHNRVDWHYHENPYFTYLLSGKLYEANKKESYYLKSGSLLYHHWQDAHYNIKPDIYTRGFHIELNAKWFKRFDLKTDTIEGSHYLENPKIKGLINKVFLETKINDSYSNTSIDTLIIEIFNTINQPLYKTYNKKPKWLNRLEEILMEDNLQWSLNDLSLQLQIHPVHLSREFSKYFGMTFGQYIRQVKLNKAILLINANVLSMTEICYACGFYDQSHFIRTFKTYYGNTPLKLLKKIYKR